MKSKISVFIISFLGSVFLTCAQAAELTTHSEMPVNAESSSVIDNSNNSQNVGAIEAEKNPESEMTGFSRGTVARSIFTTLIDNREPVDKVKQVPEKINDVFYFTELRDMSGQTAKHRWEFKGKVIAEVKFNVRGPRWRVWSKKSFTPGWSGDWKVSVVNGANEVISEEVIAFTEAPQAMVESEVAGSANAKSTSTLTSEDGVKNQKQLNTVEPPNPPILK